MQTGNKTDYSRLYQAVLSLRSEAECAAFFEDLFTVTELNSLAQRLKVAALLRAGKTCAAICEQTGASTATVSRVGRCLHYGAGGYQLALARLSGPAEEGGA